MHKQERITLYGIDCRDAMGLFMVENSVDSIVTDPPYGLGFMGKEWDHGVPGVEFWKHAFDVLKPGGHLLAFSGSRTYHRMVCAIEDAGFEIRDQIMWVYGSGFPKSLDVSKAIDKAAGAERVVIGSGRGRTGEAAQPNGSSFSDDEYQWPGVFCITAPSTEAAQQWQGWGTALKPAHEPICVARKPLVKGNTVAANVLHWGTGALNIDACRVETDDKLGGGHSTAGQQMSGGWERPWMSDEGAVAANIERSRQSVAKSEALGRWPANLIHDGSDEVLAAFPQAPGQLADESRTAPSEKTSGIYGAMKRQGEPSQDSDNEGAVGFKMKQGARRLDAGSAARFFYCAKASKKDRNEGLTDPGPQFTHGVTLRNIENTATVGNTHPTVKPTDLMAYLCRLVTPPGGVVLDPFMGSGSTGKAALREGFSFIGCELDAGYLAIATVRLAAEMGAQA